MQIYCKGLDFDYFLEREPENTKPNTDDTDSTDAHGFFYLCKSIPSAQIRVLRRLISLVCEGVGCPASVVARIGVEALASGVYTIIDRRAKYEFL